MKVPSGSTDRYLYFVAVDSADLRTRETGLSSFTVVFSRNGSADTTMGAPTVTEIDAATMPGVYALLLDEGTTLTAGNDNEEVCYHITQASMASVTRTVELYRPPTETEGTTLYTVLMAAITALIQTTNVAEIASVPAKDAPLHEMIQFIFTCARNKRITTASSQVVKADNGTTTIATAALSDESAQFTKGKYA